MQATQFNVSDKLTFTHTQVDGDTTNTNYDCNVEVQLAPFQNTSIPFTKAHKSKRLMRSSQKIKTFHLKGFVISFLNNSQFPILALQCQNLHSPCKGIFQNITQNLSIM